MTGRQAHRGNPRRYRVLAMNQGAPLAQGTPSQVQNDPGVIEAYLGSVDDVSSLRRPAGTTAARGGAA